MTRLAEAARAAGSPLALLSLAAPLAGVALLAWAGWLEPTPAFDARSTRLWAAAMAVGLLASAVVAALERRIVSALLRAAALLAALQLGAAWACRMSGTLEAGEGEQWPRWRTLSFGPLARPPDARLEVLPEAPDGVARLELDGREVTAPLGREVALGDGLIVRVGAAFPAPSFEVRRSSGGVEAAGLLKLAPGEPTWFEAGLLPHRFYVTLVDDPSAARIRLGVQRGKVRLLDRDVAPGERVEVEGLAVTLDEGGRWSRIDVRRRPPRWPGVSAVALAAAAGLLALRRRRGARA